jgi:hypothetical protein
VQDIERSLDAIMPFGISLCSIPMNSAFASRVRSLAQPIGQVVETLKAPTRTQRFRE